MKPKPMPAHLLVRILPDPKLKSGIILDTKTVKSIDPFCKAIVVERGSPTPQYPMTEFMRGGQEVIQIPRNTGTKLDIDGIEHRFVHVSEVIGVFTTKTNLDADYDTV